MANTGTQAVHQTCSDCGYKTTSHTMTNTGTEAVHQSCSCGYNTYTNKTQSGLCRTCACGYQDTAHGSNTNAATSSACKKCADCGYVTDSSHSMANTGTQAVHQTCSDCGYKTTSHSMANTGTASVHQTCSCGYKTTTHTYTNKAQSGLCRTCACGYQDTAHGSNTNAATASACKKCADCGYVTDTSHDFTKTGTKSECRRCTSCQYADTTHTLASTCVVPTCTSGGSTWQYCTDSCGWSENYSSLAALGHNFPYPCSSTCSRDSSHTRTPESGHVSSSTGRVIIAATCTTTGIMGYDCEYGCGFVGTQTYGPSAHTYDTNGECISCNHACSHSDAEITYAESSSTQHTKTTKCRDCPKLIPVLENHSFNLTTQLCTKCGYKKGSLI